MDGGSLGTHEGRREHCLSGTPGVLLSALYAAHCCSLLLSAHGHSALCHSTLFSIHRHSSLSAAHCLLVKFECEEDGFGGEDSDPDAAVQTQHYRHKDCERGVQGGDEEVEALLGGDQA